VDQFTTVSGYCGMKVRDISKSGGASFSPITDDARTPIYMRVGWWKPSKKKTKCNAVTKRRKKNV